MQLKDRIKHSLIKFESLARQTGLKTITKR